MLINELRNIIKKYNEEDLQDIIAEMYKAFPKNIKEDKNIDFILTDLKGYKTSGRTKKTKAINFPELKNEVEQFCNLALNGMYYAPNQIVHKKERSKWRFKVKSFVKDLETFSVYNENGDEVSWLFEIMYHVLSTACGVYLFASIDPFNAINISQLDFLEKVLIRKYANGFNEKNIKSGIQLVVNSEVDSETLPDELALLFISHMKTPDAKMMAVNESMILKEEIQNEKVDRNSRYKKTKKINELVKIIFHLSLILNESEKAVIYFKQNYINSDKEILLYILLRLLYTHDNMKVWEKEYELAVNKGVKPRKSLQVVYKHIKTHCQFPDPYYL